MPLAAPAPLTADRCAALLRLREAVADRDGGGPQDPRDRYFLRDREADGVLTPLAAQILATATVQVAEKGYHDLFQYGDRVFERENDEFGDLDETFLGSLPALCDGQGAAWRLAMVHAVEKLGDDLRAGQAPNASCTTEELAFHLIVDEARMLVDFRYRVLAAAHAAGRPNRSVRPGASDPARSADSAVDSPGGG
ncbi:hypothetical protein ACWDRR_33180 [Kitasatospora sp. NPDC003701]